MFWANIYEASVGHGTSLIIILWTLPLKSALAFTPIFPFVSPPIINISDTPVVLGDTDVKLVPFVIDVPFWTNKFKVPLGKATVSESAASSVLPSAITLTKYALFFLPTEVTA